MLFDLLRDQIAFGDLQFFLSDIPRQPDQFHPIEQRSGDGVRHVGRGNEQDLRQIERQVEVMIVERVVLLRIENLQQCRCRVAVEGGAYLVDLVEHDHGVL